ncbi:protein-disulfide reductase DsbD domain-containing protein [uncultured Devosia sp.]|uniref:protein-disulfide reductase DsbD domain-containing protein n=1 Tax=uncultured Devosia sp. TaxID=211434 RepID=UPI0035CA18AE
MRHAPFLLGLLVLLATPLAAAETPWQTVAPGVAMRLVSTGQIKADGTTLVGVEVDMPADTRTYWRVPGETGLVTELDFAGSTGITAHRILWPYPQRIEAGGYLDYVYLGPTVLPVELTLDAPAGQAEVSVVMGICSDICIPAQARFSLPIDGAKDMPNGVRIRQAAAMVPIAWDNARQPIGAVRYDAADRLLSVQLTDPDIDPASLIAATEDGEPLFGLPQKSPEPDLVLIPVLSKSHEIDLESQLIQLTFTTGMGAYVVNRSVQATD